MQHQDLPEATVDVDALARRLTSWRRRQRQQAEAAVRQLGPDAVRPLLAAWERQADQKQVWIFAATFAVGMILGLSIDHLIGDPGGWRSIWMQGVVGGVAGAVGQFVAALLSQKSLVRALAQLDDLHMVPPLLETLQSPRRDLRAVAAGALTRLLPRLEPGDSSLLDEGHRKHLYGALKTRNADLALAALSAVEHVGDSHAIRRVEAFCAGSGKVARDERVRSAAQSCLRVLRAREERTRAPHVLLRPTAAPEDPESSLLRPAQGRPSSDEQVLLRPAPTDDQEA